MSHTPGPWENKSENDGIRAFRITSANGHAKADCC